MFPGLTTTYWLTVHGLVTVLALMLYVIASHVLQHRRHPTAAIAWVLFMLLLPYLALPAFMAFGSRKLARPRALRSAALPSLSAEPNGSWAVQAVLSLGQPAPAAYEGLHVHADGGSALARLRETIGRAEHTIDLCTFILGRDAIGREVIERLCAKARAGVKVRVLLDGLGSWMSGRPRVAALREAGAEFRLFVPPLHSPLKGRTNLRDHRKLLIVDADHPTRMLWSGGRNLACEYFEGAGGRPGWRDLSFDLTGDVVGQARDLFERDWAFATGKRLVVAAGNTWPEPDALQAPAAPESTAAGVAQVVGSGPDQVDDTVYALLVTCAYRARRRIALATPYFVPEAALLMALALAARRGVAVDLLIPARSNHRLSDVARRRALRTLAAAGGRIWLAPQMLHAKLVVVDEVVAFAGSTNLDSRSLFLNYELMVAFHSEGAIRSFADWFERERAAATLHRPKPAGLVADLAEGLVLFVGFQL